MDYKKHALIFLISFLKKIFLQKHVFMSPLAHSFYNCGYQLLSSFVSEAIT